VSDRTADISDKEREYSLDELGKLADVTPRTVRYYIVEGLLPPPLTTGRNATYSQEHLDRLNAIRALKEMFLPLREIRHRLNTLTPEQMRDPAYLASLSQAVAMDRAMGKQHGRRSRQAAQHAEESSAAAYLNNIDASNRRAGEARYSRRPEARALHNHRPRHEPEPVAQPASQTWERFPLGEDAELLVRSSKVQNMGPRLYRTLHKLRHMIESEETNEERGRS
jgi:DNA-binding transcriptional MerR regulator